jgi:hypothetical protein
MMKGVIFLAELEKLQKAAELIEAMTDGKQLFGTADGMPQIFMDQGVEWQAEYPPLAIRMKRVPSADGKQFTFGFRAHLEMTGSGMDAAAMRGFEKAVRKFRVLLDTLETLSFTPTRSELEQFVEWIERREEQAKKQALEQKKDTGPIMGR